MTAMGAESAFVDTNVLLTATARRRPLHEAALRVLRDWPSAGATLFASGQVLREYLVVATRPPENNGLGMALEEALGNVAALRSRLRVLDETARVSLRLVTLLGEVERTGKRIHDANIIATMLTHKVGVLVTANAADFRSFSALARVRELTSC
jgi:predicted nucleic acid-binding protein